MSLPKDVSNNFSKTMFFLRDLTTVTLDLLRILVNLLI